MRRCRSLAFDLPGVVSGSAGRLAARGSLGDQEVHDPCLVAVTTRVLPHDPAEDLGAFAWVPRRPERSSGGATEDGCSGARVEDEPALPALGRECP